jgi:hypothetical protein
VAVKPMTYLAFTCRIACFESERGYVVADIDDYLAVLSHESFTSSFRYKL